VAGAVRAWHGGKIEQEIRSALPDVTLNTHLEPLEDPVSLADAELDRQSASGK